MKKKFLITVFALTLAVAAFAQQYNSESDFQIDWDEEVKDGVVITKYVGTRTEVSIPPKIQNYSVTAIGASAFAAIGESAFRSNRNITRVIIPNSVIFIDDDAFAGCTSLTSITIPNSVTYIGSGAFSGTGLTSITIPNSVTSIGYNAFADTGLTRITIPNSVTSIEAGAFPDRLTSITIDSGNPHFVIEGSILYNKAKTEIVFVLKGISGSITIPNSVTSIGYSAFAGCTNLTSVTIGSGVTSIGNSAFSRTGLTGITIPDSVTSIGDLAFSSCINLASVTIGSGVTSIRQHAFSGCTSLTSITIPDSVTSIGYYAFAYTSLTSITIPKSVTSIGGYAFSNCKGLTSVTFEGTISPANFDAGTRTTAFPGDLRAKYLAGGPGTYRRFANGEQWTKR